MSSSSAGAGPILLEPGKATTAWYNEVSGYNFGNPDASSGDVGHFTQVVWVGSTHLGCASAKCSFGGYMTYCNYGAPGK